jgi:serine/threonine-protein kinase
MREEELRRFLERLGVDASAIDVDESVTLTVATRSSKETSTVATLPRIDSDLVTLETIAEGGMGTVVLARQISLAREVAVKSARKDTAEEGITALVREAFVTGTLEHPSIVPVHVFGVDADGQPLLVMKRVEGVTWRALLADDEHPAWTTHLGATEDRLEANLGVLTSICRALELAHARGILHRDVKPDNVMLGPFGEVYLLDWGLATRSGTAEPNIVGTPAYMAPELANGEPADETTDVYLLGATLHRVLMGRARHSTGRAVDTILAAALSAPATYPASVPAALARLCNEACALSKAERPSSVRAFRERIAAFGRDRSALAICDVASERLARLQQLLEDAAPKPPADLALAYRLATEARFGFAQARAAFPEHGGSRDGATTSVEAAVELELRQDHVDTAAALIAEAPELAAKLAPRLEAARIAIAETARETDRLRALEHDVDPAVGAPARVGILLLFWGVQLALTIAFARPGHQVDPTTGAMVVAAVGMMLGTCVIVLAFRRRVFANQFNRRAIAALVATQAAVVINRVVGHYRHEDIHRITANDVLVMDLALALAAILVLPRAGYGIPVSLAATIAIELWPQYGTSIFAWSVCLVSPIMIWAAVRQGRATR